MRAGVSAFRSPADRSLDVEPIISPRQRIKLATFLIRHFDVPPLPWEFVGELLVERHGEQRLGHVAPPPALVTQQEERVTVTDLPIKVVAGAVAVGDDVAPVTLPADDKLQPRRVVGGVVKDIPVLHVNYIQPAISYHFLAEVAGVALHLAFPAHAAEIYAPPP